MNVNNNVSEIHASDMFGVFVEMGCGCPVAEALYDVSGASRTVLASVQPYDEEFSQRMFGLPLKNSGARAVSLENVKSILLAVPKLPTFRDERVNSTFVSSFQVGATTHGWIGIRYKERVRFYHLTLINPELTRTQCIDRVGDSCLNLLRLNVLGGQAFEANNVCDVEIDAVATLDDSTQTAVGSIPETLEFLSSYLVFAPHSGMPIRLVEWGRDKRELLVYDDSFNPPTAEYMRMLKENHNTDGASAIVISVETMDNKEVCERVCNITALGYHCIINGCKSFESCIEIMAEHFPSARFILPIWKGKWVMFHGFYG